MATTMQTSTETLSSRQHHTPFSTSISSFLGSVIAAGTSKDEPLEVGTIEVVGGLPPPLCETPLVEGEDSIKAIIVPPIPIPTPPPTPLATTTNASARQKSSHKKWLSMSTIRKRQKKTRANLDAIFPPIDAILSKTDLNDVLNAEEELAEEARTSFESVIPESVHTTTDYSLKYITGVREATISFMTLSGESMLRRAETDGPAEYDKETMERMRTRRGLIEELLETEEGYISDLRSLLTIHQTLLGENTMAPPLESVRRTIETLLEFHDRLLKELVLLFPASCRMRKDSICEKNPNYGMDVNHILAGTEAVAGIAKTFERMIKEFYIYEEYAAQYSSVTAEVEERRSRIHPWRTLERGCEALSISTMPGYASAYEHGKRGATLDDLAMKPIQRICRYTLLLDQLLSATPSKDCPNANRLLEGVVHRLKEVTIVIDQSSNRELFPKMEKTWILQRRLTLGKDSRFSFRLLGRNALCGVLHAAWLNKNEEVTGQYVICLLYKSYLLLATLSHGPSPRYLVRFAIVLAFARIEDVSTCAGMEVTTAAHTFRLCFEENYKSYEILLTACTADEETKWREKITSMSRKANHEYYEFDSTFPTIPTPIQADILPITSLSPARRKAPHTRSSSNLPLAAGPLPSVRIAIVNTKAHYTPSKGKDGSQLPARSASSSSTGVTVLAPRPHDRATLENFLLDVYTKKHLPMGLMGRPSRNGNMRRFSVKSLSSLNSLPTILKDEARSWASTPGSASRRGNSMDVDYFPLMELSKEQSLTISPEGFEAPPRSSSSTIKRSFPKRTRSAPDFSKAMGRIPSTPPVGTVEEPEITPPSTPTEGVQASDLQKKDSTSSSKFEFRTAIDKGSMEKVAQGAMKLLPGSLSQRRKELGKSFKRLFRTKEEGKVKARR